MSGVAGIGRRSPGSVDSLARMAAAIRHRGPDGYGFYLGQRVSLAHVRLSIVDVAAGAQPMTNEDGSVVITYDGEIYNHPELRRELEQAGHTFRTRSDSEVLVHGYEQWGVELLQRLIGEFAFAIYDRTNESVFLARDRFGVRPLFYAQPDGELFFASEIKGILASGEVSATVDPRGIDEIFTFGAARAPRTPFAGIAALEPGTYGIWRDGALFLHRYYELDYPEALEEAADVVEQLDELMLRSVGMRLRADVSVGAHLNGTLDSSIMASLAASASPQTLRTFFVELKDAHGNGSELHREIAAAIGSIHVGSSITAKDVVGSLAELIWHAETPALDADAAVVYFLARVAKESGIKSLLTSDGADDLFLGHDLFKDVQVSSESLSDPLFSHRPRFALTARTKEFYSPEFRARLTRSDSLAELRASLPARFFGWSWLNRAAYLQMTTRLSPYVLGAAGDRMTAAHGVEFRFPFLDHRLYEFASALPTRSRLRGLHDREILRRWAKRILPTPIESRVMDGKSTRDARALDILAAADHEWVSHNLNDGAVARVGIFAPAAVENLLRRAAHGLPSDDDAVSTILSTQVWHQLLIERPVIVAPLPIDRADVVVTESRPAEDAPSLRKLRL